MNLAYTSGSIFSRLNFNLGYFECRVKISSGHGTYPVFWLWHHDELVVFEFFGDSKKQFVSMHRGEKVSSESFELVENYADEYHTYALEWTPLEIRWYFDGQLIKEDFRYFDNVNQNGISCKVYDSNEDYILNDTFPQIDDRWMGVNLSLNIYEWDLPDSTTQFPAQMYVDYVRVYQTKNNSADQSPVYLSRQGGLKPSQ